MTKINKDLKFMADAKFFANNHSKDESTKVGALIVGEDGEPLSWGYNGFPRGADDEKKERHERPLKYIWSEHAERNAIYNAARSGIRLLGGRIYINTMPCCVDCARAIIQSGIKTVCLESSAFDRSNPRAEAWMGNWKIIEEMFHECGVEVKIIKDETPIVSK